MKCRETSQPKGYAFVEFNDFKAAQKAVDMAQKQSIRLGYLVLQVELAIEKPLWSSEGLGGARPRYDFIALKAIL